MGFVIYPFCGWMWVHWVPYTVFHHPVRPSPVDWHCVGYPYDSLFLLYQSKKQGHAHERGWVALRRKNYK